MQKQNVQKDSALTPMMAQYVEIKTANPDSLLFYRMGDFYELFFDDAEEASRALGITLTKRGKHQGEDIPMCGVPVHTADDYLQRLIALGFRVSVCEQLENPADAKKRGAKAVVKRDVVRLVTPGTLTEETLLDANSSNFLAGLARVGKGAEANFALSWVDLSTGDFNVAATSRKNLETELSRIDAKELIVSETLYSDQDFKTTFDQISGAVASQPAAFFESETAQERIKRFFKLETLEAFGTFSRAEHCAMAAILSYLEKTQISEKPVLNRPVREEAGGIMLIDPATRANLELVKTLSGEKKGTLLSTLNMTVTGPGSRLLTEHLTSPSLDLNLIHGRLDAIDFFLSRRDMREELRNRLKEAPDMARALSRLTLSRGGPRDMAAIKEGLKAALLTKQLLSSCKIDLFPKALEQSIATLDLIPHSLLSKLQNTLKDDLPLLKRDGGFVKNGYHKELDETRSLRDESRKVIASLQQEYSVKTDIKALKIKHNNVLGYFIEVSAQHAQRMMNAPLSDFFIHRQSLANAVRFTTSELSSLQSKILNAAEQVLSLELQIFDDLEKDILSHSDTIKKIAHALANLDVSSANATLAERRNYCRPKVDDTLAFDIEKGRHPVVEIALQKAMGDPFIANDANLGSQDLKGGKIWLITGPNMAGKSTFLRQNALIAIMAQSGFYVPASKAHIGLVDRLFSRVGASDDLARGRSTFMVEMVETAAILNQAGPHSLVILDEIGRGTATFDGLSIAWAAIEHLHEENRSRSLFATHYHELTVLSDTLERLSNATVKVSEWKGDVIFLHEIVAGAADRSYGIQVAKLAGLPKSVIQRAKHVLNQLEASERQNPAVLVDDLPLFNTSTTPSSYKEDKDILSEALTAINPDDLTPRQALEELYALKKLIKESE